MRINLLGLAMILLGLTARDTIAKEGADQYPNGAENWLAGAAPPAGNYFLNYSGHYSGSLRNGDSNEVSEASLDTWFNAFRFIHISETRILGGNFSAHIVIPIVHQSMNCSDCTSISGLGDITISPVGFSWHLGDWHWVAAMDIRMPTGKYKAGKPEKSIGTNYWSIEPLFAVTWLSEKGWEISNKFMYNIKDTNKEFRTTTGEPQMDYASGDELHIDFLVGKRFGLWGIGLSGYYLKQTTNDKLDGQIISPALGPWSPGRKGEVLAIGPSVIYNSPTGTILIGQLQNEMYATNRFQGYMAWLRLNIPF
ncbi:SphA family protein [Nitrosomonas marina]|uniref:Uncharacterized conserved protein n=1 Tax=Nitrosomonas marina TaxID=917 RepID=A0A1H8IRK0_9PROT|nr:transporter [Nitrosomonas marina]SEN71022.1 Uncharacterized conserved protein [Nitrosomonas marina]